MGSSEHGWQNPPQACWVKQDRGGQIALAGRDKKLRYHPGTVALRLRSFSFSFFPSLSRPSHSLSLFLTLAFYFSLSTYFSCARLVVNESSLLNLSSPRLLQREPHVSAHVSLIRHALSVPASSDFSTIVAARSAPIRRAQTFLSRSCLFRSLFYRCRVQLLCPSLVLHLANCSKVLF